MIPRSCVLLPVLALAACGPDQPRVRSYVDRTVSVPAPAGPDMARLPSGGPPVPALPALALAYDAPADWHATPGSGSRLVTFRVPFDGQTLECAIHQLGPEAADPVANVTRWIGQLGGSPSEAAVAEFCARMPALETRGGWKGSFVDLKEFAGDAGSMLAAMLPLPDRMLFVKLTGPAAALEGLRAPFEALCRSLREEP